MQHEHLMHTRECFSGHMGAWAIRPDWLMEALAALRADALPMRSAAGGGEGADRERAWSLLEGGVALIRMEGAMQKGRSKYMGTVSTIDTRRSVRQAVSDNRVNSLLMVVDSPGGHAYGTHELAEDVRTAASRKPVHVHVEDLGASAAVWAISGASRITANLPAQVGSIGTYTVVQDLSKKAELEGIEVHVVSTGKNKGLGVAGTEVTQELLAQVRTEVESVNRLFLSAVASGRNLNEAQIAAVSDGRTWSAEEAQSLGLIDAVEPLDDVIGRLVAPPLRDVAAEQARGREHELRVARLTAAT